MRKDLWITVALMALALAGCKGSSGDSMGLDVCGIGCVPNDPDDDDDDDPDPPAEVTSGNAPTLVTGDTTLAFENGVLVSPGAGSVSRLTRSGPGNNRAKFEINTKAATGNTGWLEPNDINEYAFGSSSTPDRLGARSYQEYRVAGPRGAGRDEVLQVWEFSDDTYATQYRRISGTESPNRAFSFGGNKTAVASMPTAGAATYRGAFASLVTGANWINPGAADPNDTVIDRNQNFQNSGTAVLTADFGAGTMNGTLTAERWRWFDESESDFLNYSNATDTIAGSTNTVNEPGFFRNTVTLNADITGNSYKGTATMGPQWVAGRNPVLGSFFGTGASETTGVFAVDSTAPGPIGGDIPIDDDRAGYVGQSGIFHGTCQAGGACTP